MISENILDLVASVMITLKKICECKVKEIIYATV